MKEKNAGIKVCRVISRGKKREASIYTTFTLQKDGQGKVVVVEP